jgi:hypothetical protein
MLPPGPAFPMGGEKMRRPGIHGLNMSCRRAADAAPRRISISRIITPRGLCRTLKTHYAPNIFPHAVETNSKLTRYQLPAL